MRKVILNTRPEGTGDGFETMLKEKNFRVINFPLIKIVPAQNYSEIEGRLERIEEYDGLIFTSGNAARIFLERAADIKIKVCCSIFSVGEKTKRVIEEFGYACEELPEKSDSKELAKMIVEKNGKDGKYLFPKGKIGMNKIQEYLQGADGIVVYDTVFPDNTDGIDDVRNMLNNNEVDCLVFFSPSAVKNFSAVFHGFIQDKTAVAVIGETTKKRAESAGLRVNIMPGRYTSEELANEIIKYFNE
ncbi:MAG: uroporphyrinogen-III synthase [Bacteroidetes bacterium]|nr:uroporphyrinogen-III synthase [Bacteroidota bacterium]